MSYIPLYQDERRMYLRRLLVDARRAKEVRARWRWLVKEYVKRVGRRPSQDVKHELGRSFYDVDNDLVERIMNREYGEPRYSEEEVRRIMSEDIEENEVKSGNIEEWMRKEEEIELEFRERPYFAEIEINNIIPHPGIPERESGAIEALRRSMEKEGQQQDVILEEAEEEGKYYRLAGKGRIEALRRAGETRVQAKVYKRGLLSNKQRLGKVHAENIHWERTAPYRARLYKAMVEARYSQREIAWREDRTEQEISNIMRVNELPQTIHYTISAKVRLL